MTNRSLATMQTEHSTTEDLKLPQESGINRRSFLRNSAAAGAAAAVGSGILADIPAAFGQQSNGQIHKGDAAILRFLAAAEIIESDLWLQYLELAGVQDNEVSTLASKLIPGYPAQPTGGNPQYTVLLQKLDPDAAVHSRQHGR